MGEKVFMQSQGGTEVTVDLSIVRSLEEQIINSGILELTIEQENTDLYEPIEAVFAWSRNDEGELIIVGVPEDTNQPIVETFPDGVSTLGYRINLTSHLDGISKGEIENDTILLIPVSKAQRPNRSIILGPEHPLSLIHI